MAAVFLLASASAWSQPLKAVDLYRTDQISAGEVSAQLGPLLSDYARLRREGPSRKAAKLQSKIESKVRAMGDFAFVQLYYGEYANSAGRSSYVTFDIVDAKEEKARMPFRAAPTGRFADPGGLLAAWKRYDAVGLKQSGQGYIDDDARPRCPGFYCRWGSGTKALAALEGKIAAGAEPNKAALIEIAAADRDPGERAAALYVLSYTEDGADLAKRMLSALDDPDPAPRAAALQVLSALAANHREIPLDLGRLAPALDYPTVSDRAKALEVMLAEAENPAASSTFNAQVVPRLLPLLKLSQPSNHDLAFTILTLLSGESYDRRDYASWEKWVTHVH